MGTETGLLESYVQVGPDSTGKRVRNLLVTVPQPDGTTGTAYMQVVGVADPDGFPVENPAIYQQEVLAVLREIKSGIDLLLEALT